MALHARFMISTAIPLLPPALARVLGHFVLPAPSSFDMALHLSFAAAEMIVLAPLLHDRQSGPVRAPYQLLMALLVQYASVMVAMQFAPWRAVVASIQDW